MSSFCQKNRASNDCQDFVFILPLITLRLQRLRSLSVRMFWTHFQTISQAYCLVKSTKHASCWGWQELNPCRPDQIGRDTAFALSQLGLGGGGLIFNQWFWQIGWPNANQRLFNAQRLQSQALYVVPKTSILGRSAFCPRQLMKLAPSFHTLFARRQAHFQEHPVLQSQIDCGC
jgi:hypothetical protein